KLRWHAWVVEGVGIPLERDLLFRNSCGCESLDHVFLDAPGHGADESFRGRRRVGGADLQDLGDERRVIGDPVAHYDPAAGPCHTNELLCDIERLRSEHRAEYADDEVEAVVLELA